MRRQDNRSSLIATERIPREVRRTRWGQKVSWTDEIKKFAWKIIHRARPALFKIYWRGPCPAMGVDKLVMISL